MEHGADIKYLELVAAGDHEAFRALFLGWHPRVRDFIACLVRSGAVAEDLAQDIFLKIWNHREMLPAIRSADAYIYRMARNAAMDYLKSRRVRQTHRDNIEAGLPDTPYELFLARESELLVGLLVDGMPAQRRRVFEMSRYEGLRNDEIASRLDITTKTVENHLNLALREIRRALALLALFFPGAIQ